MSAELVTLINSTLAGLGADYTVSRVPPPIPCAESLKGRALLMLDDHRRTLQIFAPPLIAATGRKAHFILHERQSLDSLVKSIIELRPEIALIDYYLQPPLIGTELVRRLSTLEPALRCIGFSSDPAKESEFLRAGALGSVVKSTDQPDDSIMALGLAVEGLRLSRGTD